MGKKALEAYINEEEKDILASILYSIVRYQTE